MAPSQSTRPGRDGDIPNNFIVKWRKSAACNGDGAAQPKPHPSVRRPITACDNCRTAKVRCNGRQDCQRCTTRGLACAYRTSSTASGRRSPPAAKDGSPVTMSPALPSSSTSQVPAPVSTSPCAPSLVYSGGVDPETMTPVNWTCGPQHHSLNHVDWTGTLDPSLNGHAFGWMQPSFPLDWDALEATMQTTPHHHEYPRGSNANSTLLATNSQCASAAPTSPLASGLPQSLQSCHQTSPSSLNSCPCRASLMLCVPKITDALREKKLDEILSVTGDVAKYCQEILYCTTHEVRCSDLLLIMSVLQETNPCFDYIAKHDESADGCAIKLSFGRYEVTSNSASFRAAMILELVERARTVVAAISAKGQSMISQLPEPSDLAKANITYLEATISHYRTMLNCVAYHMDDALSRHVNGCGEGSDSTVPAPSLSPSQSTTPPS